MKIQMVLKVTELDQMAKTVSVDRGRCPRTGHSKFNNKGKRKNQPMNLRPTD
jgi:hypothetical protein